MGGCATKPKELNGDLPDEEPSAPELVARSVDIPAVAPVTAVEAKEAGEVVKVETEIGVDVPTDDSTSKTEAIAAEATGEEAGNQESETAKVEPAKPDAAVTPKDSADDQTTKHQETPAPPEHIEESTTVFNGASEGEATAEAKKPLDAKTSVEEVSHKEEEAAARIDSNSA